MSADAPSPAGRGLLAEVIRAHGGLDLWQSTEEISCRVSWGGFGFALKGRRPVRSVTATVSTRRQLTVLEPYPNADERGVFEEGIPRIESAAGEVIRQRVDARAAFRDLRHKVWWDDLDTVYFAGYAMWTYLSLPFVADGPGYEVREIEPWDEDGQQWRRLAVRFPADVHTHSQNQVLYFDGDGRLRRHDYTAEPFGDWAKGAHYCFDHREVAGLLVPTRRKVFPRRSDGRPRRGPLLVWVEVDDLSLR